MATKTNKNSNINENNNVTKQPKLRLQVAEEIYVMKLGVDRLEEDTCYDNMFTTITREQMMQVWADNIAYFVETNVRPEYECMLRNDYDGFRKRLDVIVNSVLKKFYRTDICKRMELYVAETDMRQFIKDIFKKVLGIEHW